MGLPGKDRPSTVPSGIKTRTRTRTLSTKAVVKPGRIVASKGFLLRCAPDVAELITFATRRGDCVTGVRDKLTMLRPHNVGIEPCVETGRR